MSQNLPTLDETLAQLKNGSLRSFVSMNSWERGHSAGEDEVAAIAASLAYELKTVDDYITYLEQIAGI